MKEHYATRQSLGARTSRVGRPNPRVPLDPVIAEIVAEVRLSILARRATIGLEMFPVSAVAAPIVRQRLPNTDNPLWPEVLGEVVEAVLACPAARRALRDTGVHVS